MTEGLGFEPEDDDNWPGVRKAFGEHQQEGLTKAAALARLTDLKVRALAAVQAIEQAPHTADGITFVDGHLVSFAEGYGYAVTPGAGCQQHLAARDEAGDTYDLAWVLRVVQIVDRWLDSDVAIPYQDQPLAQDWARVAKIAEESGETREELEAWRKAALDEARVSEIDIPAGRAIAALIAVTGQNPRKGVHGTQDDLLKELADVAMTALLAIQHFTKDAGRTWDVVLAALAKALSRVPEADRGVLAEIPGRDDDDLPPVMEPGDV